MEEVVGDKCIYLIYYAHLVGIKKKKLTARMHGVERFTKNFKFRLDLTVKEQNLVTDFVNLVMDSVNSRKLTE
jgi:hypothetical protein